MAGPNRYLAWGAIAMGTFPSALGLSPDQVEEAVRMAGMAPSLHNSQPWRLRVRPDVIEVHSDPARRVPAADPDDRELRLGCGAALFNLRLALENTGIRPVVTLLPRMAGPSAVAEVRRSGSATPVEEQMRLYRAIPARRSNRRPFRETPVPATMRHELINAVQKEQSWLHLVQPAERGTLEGLVHRAHRVQMGDQRFRNEMAYWTGRPAGEAGGVPAAAAGPEREPHDQWVLRDFSAGKAPARVPGKDFEQDPLLVVLCSYNNSRLADVQAGQAMQRMLLTATTHGLAASLMSQVVEVRETWDELRRLLGGSVYPQALLRIGYGSPSPATPRRSPEALLMSEQDVAG